MKLLILFLFFLQIGTASYSQEIQRTYPLVKIIKDVSSPDSNTVIVTYDAAARVSALTEYAKINGFWFQVEQMTYRRDQNGNIHSIKWDGKDNTFAKHILRNDTDEFILINNKNKLIGAKYASKPNSLILYEYNNDDLIIREIYMNSKNEVYKYWENKYDEYGRVDTATQYTIEDPSKRNIARQTLQITIRKKQKNETPEDNSMAEPFLINDQNTVLFNPFRAIVLDYLNNYDHGFNVELVLNNGGFPKSISYLRSSGGYDYNYEFLYLPWKTESLDFKWSEYLISKNTPYYKKHYNLETYKHINPLTRLRKKPKQPHEAYAALDLWNIASLKLRSGIPLTLAELKQVEVPYISNVGLGDDVPNNLSVSKIKELDIYVKRESSEAGEINRAVLIYSLNKSSFRVENHSEYPFLVHLTGHKDVFLTPRAGATYSKDEITDSSKITLEYPDSNFVLRHKALLYEINLFGGKADATNTNIDFALENFLGRERLPSPTIVWEDVFGNRREEKPTPVQDQIEGLAADFIFITISGMAKQEIENKRKELEYQLKENMEIFAATKGIINKYTGNITYDAPLKSYIDVKFKQLK